MVRWCCAVSMATGTKACAWPLTANCILHSSFVNCCLPSSDFLLGRGTKPRTGGIRNGTSALPEQPGSSTFAFHLSLSPSRSLRLPCFYLLAVCAPLTLSSPFFFPLRSEYVFTSFLPFPARLVGTSSDPPAQT